MTTLRVRAAALARRPTRRAAGAAPRTATPTRPSHTICCRCDGRSDHHLLLSSNCFDADQCRRRHEKRHRPEQDHPRPMKPELFYIPFVHFPVHGYGLMMVLGFILALQLAHFLARRSGLDPELFVNAGLIALLSGIVGARLSHVIENWADYTRPDLSFGQNLWNAINLTSGGLTYYGGFLLAFPVTVLYGVMSKIPLRLGMDIIAPCLMIGLGFGRVGCFLNGCCYGAPTNLPAP